MPFNLHRPNKDICCLYQGPVHYGKRFETFCNGKLISILFVSFPPFDAKGTQPNSSETKVEKPSEKNTVVLSQLSVIETYWESHIDCMYRQSSLLNNYTVCALGVRERCP